MDSGPPPPTSFQLPDTMPVIVLEECYLFPGCYLPLFIFEQRYREMLAHALSTHRMFCVGTRLTPGEDGEILPVSTAGLVRASRKQDDGTSNVMLHGLCRIRFTGWAQIKPFRIANIAPIHTIQPVDDAPLLAARDKALSLLPTTPACAEGVKLIRDFVDRTENLEQVCDVLSYHFVHCPAALHRLLAEPVLEKRYDLLLESLVKNAAKDGGANLS